MAALAPKDWHPMMEKPEIKITKINMGKKRRGKKDQVLALPMLNNKLQKKAALDDLEKQDEATVNQTKVGTVLEPAAKDFLSEWVECMWTFLSV